MTDCHPLLAKVYKGGFQTSFAPPPILCKMEGQHLAVTWLFPEYHFIISASLFQSPKYINTYTHIALFSFIICSQFIQKPFTLSTRFLHDSCLYYSHKQQGRTPTTKLFMTCLQDFFHNTRADKLLISSPPFFTSLNCKKNHFRQGVVLF